MTETIVNSEQLLNQHIEKLRADFDKHKYLKIKVETGKQRTGQQNKSLHVYSKLMANALNDAGYDYTWFVKLVEKQGFKTPWTLESFKDGPWKLVQKAVFPHTIDKKGNARTSKLNRQEVSQVYDIVNAKFIEQSGVHVPWPHIE